jgi:hypothetical protein
VVCAEWHPDDERLLVRYVERTADETLAQHLDWCRPCARRMSALTRDLDGWHLAADQESDEEFDDQRLAAQRRGIQQRLGAVVPGRLLPFPGPASLQRHLPLAWVAAAMLLIGLAGAGMLRVLQMPQPGSSLAAFRGVPTRATVPMRLVVRDTSADAAVLEDIDLALLRPRTPELRALDEFTPYARDIVASRR